MLPDVYFKKVDISKKIKIREKFDIIICAGVICIFDKLDDFFHNIKKLSKNNTFMDDKGKPYSLEEISDKKNSLVIIYNHGSIQDHKQDPCKAKPKFGYIWDAAVIPAVLKLHNKKINGLDYRIMIKMMNNSLKKVANDRDAIFIDLENELEFDLKNDFYDNSHNTPQGSIKIGHYLYEKTKDLF